MKTKIIIASFIIFLISMGLLFWKYFQIKKDIYYVETESLLYRYYDDYHYAHNQQVQYDKFVASVAAKDNKLYKLLKEQKIVLFPEGFAYVRTPKFHTFIGSDEFNFSKFLFSRANIGIDKLAVNQYIDYEIQTIYEYKNHRFIEKGIFNKYMLRDEYADFLNCRKNKVMGNENAKALVVINPKEVSFIKSEFDKESEIIIKKILRETYSGNDTIMINLMFYNIKEAKCLDRL